MVDTLELNPDGTTNQNLLNVYSHTWKNVHVKNENNDKTQWLKLYGN